MHVSIQDSVQASDSRVRVERLIITSQDVLAKPVAKKSNSLRSLTRQVVQQHSKISWKTGWTPLPSRMMNFQVKPDSTPTRFSRTIISTESLRKLVTRPPLAEKQHPESQIKYRRKFCCRNFAARKLRSKMIKIYVLLNRSKKWS